ncbi:glycosyltransferase family 4 protein [Kocuria sp. JC486]|uniref:glycosyltransferase n=1 Tax=Kocuria sp. JC486 TaxID=1970736 RepID=UPI00142330A0|nr:glycosyltransferase [Kocuria sp. JC486]NHU85372.1 glycosyltransferase family 4 protein [Kocuria sp. JC486]
MALPNRASGAIDRTRSGAQHSTPGGPEAGRGGHRRRVLHVVEAFGGGVAAAVRDYVRALPECEHHLVCRLRPEADTLEPEWIDEFASIHRIDGGHMGATKFVRATLAQLRPDVVHAHSSYAGVWARTALVGIDGVRCVYTPHAWAFDREDKSAAERRTYRSVERALSRRTDVLAGCSRAENQEARKWGSKLKTVYVPNVAPDPQREITGAPIQEWTDPRGPLVVGSGRLTMQKDPEWFAQLIAALRASGESVRALWVGGGDDALQASLEAQDIEVTGWVDPGTVLEHLAQADLYVHTARWEGFPITVLEAARLDRPMAVRGIRAFDDIGMPLVLQEPAEIVQHWGRLKDPQARSTVVAEQHAALWENTRSMQRERLAEAYGIELLPTGALGIDLIVAPAQS